MTVNRNDRAVAEKLIESFATGSMSLEDFELRYDQLQTVRATDGALLDLCKLLEIMEWTPRKPAGQFPSWPEMRSFLEIWYLFVQTDLPYPFDGQPVLIRWWQLLFPPKLGPFFPFVTEAEFENAKRRHRTLPPLKEQMPPE